MCIWSRNVRMQPGACVAAALYAQHIVQNVVCHRDSLTSASDKLH